MPTSSYLLLAVAAGTLLAGPALAAKPAPSFQTLYTFTGGADGGNPDFGLLPGPNGSFYGTTSSGTGTIFQFLPPAAGQTAWTLNTLYSFTGGADGNSPEYLIADAQGALYGMTDMGGIFNGTCTVGTTDVGCGTVFKLTPPAAGQTAWTLSTLYAFTGGADSSAPTGGVVMDKKGNLFGFTDGIYKCASGQCGSAYELSPPVPGQTAWTLTTLHNFTGGQDGGNIGHFGLPVLDPSGKIFGTAGTGGKLNGANCSLGGGCGLVFELTPPAPGSAVWGEQTLLTFHGGLGITPFMGLTEDAAGNLYGETDLGGDLKACSNASVGLPAGCGVAYMLSPPAPGATAWTTTILHRFTDGKDGSYPLSLPTLIDGGLYMSTTGDEVTNYGTINELIPPIAPGGLWRNETKYSFTNGTDGSVPAGPLVQRNGVIYGTTAPFSATSNGTIFALTP